MNLPGWAAEGLGALRERLDAPWEPAGWGALAASGLFLLFVAFGRTADGWTPMLDGVNLLFHEAGHPLFGLLGSETLAALGGTLMQVLIPAALTVGFGFKRQPLGTALCGQWMGENLLYVARYMADARAQELPLVGGGEHDWGTLFGQWGLLEKDQLIAGRVAFLGWALLVGWALWLGWRVWCARQAKP